MQISVGAVVDGKVTGITKFGAFVAIEGGGSGLVHISEVANTYVNDISDYLTVGQAVKVRVLSIGDGGKINLSLKRAAEGAGTSSGTSHLMGNARPANVKRADAANNTEVPADKAFEDRLKKFMQESDSRISDNRMYSEHRERRRRK